MPNQYHSEDKTIGELLSMTSPNIEASDWQRDYSWDTSEVKTFWQDLVSFSDQYPGDNITGKDYFLGSIVIVNKGIKYLLLDGQQRLATATTLLSVIRDYLMEYNKDAAIRTSQKYIADLDDATGTYSFQLTLSWYDRDFFRREVQEFPSPEHTPPKAELDSHKLIRKSREFFKRRFEEKYKALSRGKEAFDWALRIQKVLTNHVSVVAVISTDEDNASTVFETLNDRGIGLSTPDLLRNLLLRRADDTSREEIIDRWREVLEVEEYAKVEDFLRHYWLSHNGDVKTRSLYREIKKKFLDENTNSLEFFRDLREVANLYRELMAGRDDDPELQRLLESVSMLGARSLMPAILSSYAVGCLNEKKMFLRSLITLYIRHNVIGNLENSQLETVVFDIAKQLRQNRDFAVAIRQMKEIAPSDDQFVNQFKIAQVRKQGSARYILRELEQAKRATKELKLEAPDRVHVEHIYPQRPLKDQGWEDHNSVVNRIGNLTLLSRPLNTKIKNSDFTTKKDYYTKSDILLTRELLDYDTWDIGAINDRQQKMSEHILSIWSFPE